MRMLFSFALITTALTPLAARAQEVENSISASIESGRIFADQGLVQYRGRTYTGEYEISYGDWYASAWHAHTEPRASRETDLCAGKTGNMAPRVEYDTNACVFLLDGTEAYQLEFNVEYEITDELTFAARADVIRGGFETDVVYGGLAFTRGPFDVNGGVSGDSWSGDVVLQAGAGIALPLHLRAFVNGFSVLDEGDPTQSDDENAYVFGIGTNYTF